MLLSYWQYTARSLKLTPLLTFCDKYFVKVKVKMKFTLEQAMKAQKGVEALLYSYFNLDARWW
jgi:tRNA G26 N,N-dimethylase Trm1